jgi:LmbE family N-acetylglucosaminyl deacetylase/glycosyltransferase involved in cell wall biosynthesis
MKEESRIPFEASELDGRRLLVLAAHPDDEVGGPGGTLCLRAPYAEAIRIWVATDGTRQEGVAPGGEAEYARRRREESAAAASVLGLPPPEFGGLADRELAGSRGDLEREIGRLFSEFRPDLVFGPSPVEIHPDHRALAEALYARVASSRPEDEDHDLYRYVRLAFYEISHPLLPNALVDIASVSERKARALAAFASQQAVRDYAGALGGLNAYRRLTLGGRGAAEAFRLTTFAEVSTRSLAEFRGTIGPSLVESGERGVVPAAVVVRTRNRPALLREAVASLAGQQQRPSRVVVVNDGGAPVGGLLASFDGAFEVRLEELPQTTGRSAAANRGLALAGESLVGFLDDDDRCYPDHLERLARAHRAGPEAVVYSDAVTIHYRRQGEEWEEARRELQYSLDFDPDYLLLANYIPIHTVLAPAPLLRKAGGFDESLEYSEDWDLLIRLAGESPFRHVRAVTCEYRVFGEGEPGHVASGGEAFQRARQRIYERYRERRTEEGMARVIDRLRAQVSVWYHREGENRERLAEAGRLAARCAALEAERPKLAARLSDLARAHQESGAKIEERFREITRLNGLLSEIYRSRTWKLHLWLERLRGRR